MKVAVIGGGPAGILLVAELYLKFEQKMNNNYRYEIVWYDNENFLSGMMNKYEVPSNTKMDYLDKKLGFFERSPVGVLAKVYPEIQESINLVRANSLSTPSIIEHFDPSEGGWPKLKDMRNLFVEIANVLKRTNIVKHRNNEVYRCIKNKDTTLWTVYYGDKEDKTMDTNIELLSFCCGAKPASFLDDKIKRLTNNTTNIIHMEDALSCQRLKKIVGQNDKIAVLGNAHSSILAIRNLVEVLHVKRENIFVYCKNPIKYAKWHDEKAYVNNSTGIKGMATAFAMEDRTLKGNQSIFNREEDSNILWSLLKKNPSKFAHIIPLIGVEANKLPEMFINDSEEVIHRDLRFETETSQLFYKTESIGYEMGASRPEYYTDHPKFKYPIIALEGGGETTRKGWVGERIVGWALFRLRALQIVKDILNTEFVDQMIQTAKL
eukprot:g5591.t1